MGANDQTLLEKLQAVVIQHYVETGERVDSFHVDWHRALGGSAAVLRVSVSISSNS